MSQQIIIAFFFSSSKDERKSLLQIQAAQRILEDTFLVFSEKLLKPVDAVFLCFISFVFYP